MAINKVAYNGRTLIDLTGDTVTADTLSKGTTAHDKSGKAIVGTMESGSSASAVILKPPNMRTGLDSSPGKLSVWGWAMVDNGAQWYNSSYLFLGDKYAEYIGGDTLPMTPSLGPNGVLTGLPDAEFLTDGELLVLTE